jgi:hypothetical protein
MGPRDLKFGGGVSDTVLNPAVLMLILIACAMICFAPRQKALAAFLTAGILIPVDQVLVLAGAHFPMLRVLAIFGFVRILKERRPSKTWLFAGGFNNLDRTVILLAVTTALGGIILFREFGAVIYQAGTLCTTLGSYLLLRLLIRDEEDVIHGIRVLAWITAFCAVVMAYEHARGENPYALLHGARAAAIAHLVQRSDRFRAQGPFAHSILAGTFGAVVVPLFFALWWKDKKHRKIAILGIFAGTVMTIASDSSTPILGFAAGLLALILWPARRWMGRLRMAFVGLLLVLQIVMKHPVWHLIIDIDITGGSSSWHRYMLIDQCIHHFSNWCLFGVKNTGAWGWDMWDTANQYVATCDNSGLLAFIFLISILVYGFKFLGRSRLAAGKDKARAKFVWALGAALFANVVAFLGISYWDQTQVGWYALLAMISACLATRRDKGPKPRLFAPSDESVPTSEHAEQLAYVAS